jgi:hypothetical protein
LPICIVVALVVEIYIKMSSVLLLGFFQTSFCVYIKVCTYLHPRWPMSRQKAAKHVQDTAFFADMPEWRNW